MKIKAAALLFFSFSFLSCDMFRAHYHNEKGRSFSRAGKYKEAGTSFEKSISYRFMEEIPIFNLGNNYYAEKDYVSAHEQYQRALRIDPDSAEILFNDGYALFMHGKSMLDEDYCRIDETVRFLRAASSRFRETVKITGRGSLLGKRSLHNIEEIEERIKFLEQMHLQNAELCRKKNRGGGSGGGGKDKPEKKPLQNRKEPQESENRSSPEERKEMVNRALERIKKNRGRHRFIQTAPQQLRRGKGRKNYSEKGELLSW